MRPIVILPMSVGGVHAVGWHVECLQVLSLLSMKCIAELKQACCLQILKHVPGTEERAQYKTTGSAAGTDSATGTGTGTGRTI